MKPIQLTASLSAMLAAVISLGACSDKPPGCADDETRQTMKELIVNEAKKIAPGSADDPSGLIDKFMEGVQVELSGIVDDGYHADAKKQSCKATMKVTVPGGQPLEEDIAYTTQRTVDDRSKFLLQVENIDPLSLQLGGAAHAYYDANRWAGTYSGTYACTGVGGATNGPDGPYSVPIAMSVRPSQDGHPSVANIERTLAGGGYEKLAGTAGEYFDLNGAGRDSSNHDWTATFHGTIHGNVASGTGFSREPDGPIQRNCKLELTRGAAAAPVATGDQAPDVAASRKVGTENQAHNVAGAGTMRSDPSAATTDFSGSYAGIGGGNLSVEIGTANAAGSYPVVLTTNAQIVGGGGCGGVLKGLGQIEGSAMKVSSDEYGHCDVSMKREADGRLQIDEGGGCQAYHGAACNFEGAVAKQ